MSEATVSKIIAGVYPTRSVRSRGTRVAVLEEIARQSGLTFAELDEITAAAEPASKESAA